jgi:4-hydroxy-tetrahydrodipicolinate synthase
MSIFKGSGVAIVTPFDENLEVDLKKLGELINFQIENGTDAIIICGTTGESATLKINEQKACISEAVKIANKRVPVIAGTGSNDTAHAIELSVLAQECGADALLVVTPYYNKATQKGLIAHFTAIANSVTLPIVLYNVPSRTGCNLLPKTVVELARTVDNIVAIKDAAGNLSQTAQMMHLANGCIDVYSGNDDQIIPILSLGGIGIISVLANIAPRQIHEMCMAYLNGNWETAVKLQLDAIPLIQDLFCEVSPIPVKAALNMMGKSVGQLRLPMTTLEEKHQELLKKSLQDYGLL